MKDFIEEYKSRLLSAFNEDTNKNIEILCQSLLHAWKSKKNVFICGNGGSAGNAIHIANDFIYGVACNNKEYGGIRIEALSANPSVITCLANDVSYDSIYSEQLKVKADKGDMLIVLSGSGNSPNVIEAIKFANKLEVNTFSILGFNGGECKKISKHCIHFSIDDMQLSEDLQLIVCHICMQWLSNQL